MPHTESLDLCARKVIMSAMLYYSLDAPVLSDQEFDAMCKRCIDNWEDLSPLRQFQLGSPEELATTAYQVKITHAGVHGALDWAGYKNRKVLFHQKPKKKRLERGGKQLRYWSVGDFQWGKGEDLDG